MVENNKVPVVYKNVAALIFIEPGGAPAVDSDEYKRILDAKIPVAFYYGDYMEGKGPDEIDSTHFWHSYWKQDG